MIVVQQADIAGQRGAHAICRPTLELYWKHIKRFDPLESLPPNKARPQSGVTFAVLQRAAA